jgi:hypothetical protein
MPTPTVSLVQTAPELANSLVANTQAADFLNDFSLDTMRRARLGDPKDFEGHPQAHNAVTKANEAMRDGIDMIRRLVKDETKTLPVRHEAGERVADKTEAVFAETQRTLEVLSEQQFSHGVDIVGNTLKLRNDNVAMDWKLIEWVASQAKKENGAATIREGVMTDIDIARVVWAGKPIIMGLNAELLGSLKMSAVSAHCPDAQIHLDNAKKLSAQAKSYPQIRKSMRASFYNSSLSDKARATRVDV